MYSSSLSTCAVQRFRHRGVGGRSSPPSQQSQMPSSTKDAGIVLPSWQVKRAPCRAHWHHQSERVCIPAAIGFALPLQLLQARELAMPAASSPQQQPALVLRVVLLSAELQNSDGSRLNFGCTPMPCRTQQHLGAAWYNCMKNLTRWLAAEVPGSSLPSGQSG